MLELCVAASLENWNLKSVCAGVGGDDLAISVNIE
jgi:hypothetical protein